MSSFQCLNRTDGWIVGVVTPTSVSGCQGLREPRSLGFQINPLQTPSRAGCFITRVAGCFITSSTWERCGCAAGATDCMGPRMAARGEEIEGMSHFRFCENYIISLFCFFEFYICAGFLLLLRSEQERAGQGGGGQKHYKEIQRDRLLKEQNMCRYIDRHTTL